MIRAFKNEDIDCVMEIWLNATIEAHKFIPEDYWLNNYRVVKETYIPSSKIFVYEDEEDIKGFISICDNDYIGALFVDINHQGKGIGTKLLEFAKKRHKYLRLAVYAENERSLRFYQKSGFSIDYEQINRDSGVRELVMSWPGK